jgi:hypothetical protein
VRLREEALRIGGDVQHARKVARIGTRDDG